MSQAFKTKERNRARGEASSAARSTSPKEGWFGGLFASAKNSLVPVKKAEPVHPSLEKTLTSVRPRSRSPQQTVPSARIGDVTTPSRIQAAQKHRTIEPTAETESDGRGRAIGLVLLALMVGLVGSVLLSKGDQISSSIASKLDHNKWQERVNFHRFETGLKLNRDRIEVEYENTQTAPPLGLTGRKPVDPNVMSGLPLAPEPLVRKTSRDRLVPVNPDYPDARVMYGLQEEQAAGDWEEEAQRQYIEQFVKNASAAGYDVKVDDNLNVKVKPKRLPQSIPQDGRMTGGGSR